MHARQHAVNGFAPSPSYQIHMLACLHNPLMQQMSDSRGSEHASVHLIKSPFLGQPLDIKTKSFLSFLHPTFFSPAPLHIPVAHFLKIFTLQHAFDAHLGILPRPGSIHRNSGPCTFIGIGSLPAHMLFTARHLRRSGFPK